MKHTLRPFVFLLIMLTYQTCSNKHEKLWEEKDGMVRVEAEDGHFGDVQAGWEKKTEFPGYSGSGYVIWQGESSWGPESRLYDSIPSSNKISYRVKINTPGVYYVKVLNYHLKEDGDNDVWTSVNKNDWGKTYDWQVNAWTLDERGEWAKYKLAEGIHDVELAGRSPGFAVDQIVIFEEAFKDKFIPVPASDSTLVKK